MTGILLLINLVLTIILIGLLYESIDFIYALVLSIVYFVSVFIIVSGMFFWIDAFNMTYTLVSCIAAIGIGDLVLLLKRRKFKFNFNISKYIVPIILSILILPITYQKFEHLGMDQDGGVYQAKAIELIYGNTENQVDFEEYSTLESESEKTEFAESLRRNLVGFYRFEDIYVTTNAESRLSPVSGVYHGIPTYPAILALWGTIFGVQNMAGIQTIFLICGVFLIFLIGESLDFSKIINIFTTTLFAVSPVILWVSKAALTEIFLVILIECFILGVVSKRRNGVSEYIMLGLPLIAFSFYHVTSYTLLPLFIIIFLCLYCYTDKKQYLYTGIASVIGFVLGFTMMAYIAPRYVLYLNCTPIYELFPFINQDNVLYIIQGASLFAIILLFVIGRIRLKTIFEKLLHSKALEWGIRIFIVFCISMCIKNFISYIDVFGGVYSSFKFNTLSAYSYLTGIIVFPLILFVFIKKPKLFCAKKEFFLMGIMFIYSTAFYGAFFRTQVSSYYYYSRYLAPFIVIVCICAGICLSKINKKLVIALTTGIIVIYAPFNYVLATELDDTRMEWDNIYAVADNLEEGDAVIISEDLMSTLFLPVRAISGAFLYPGSGNLEEQIQSLLQKNENVYYLTSSGLLDNRAILIYKDTTATSEDLDEKEGNLIPLPLAMTEGETSIVLHKITEEKLEYDLINDKNLEFKGFTGLNSVTEDFIWSSSEQTFLRCILREQDYYMKIEQGAEIPFDLLDFDTLELNVVVNGVLVGTLSLSNDTNGTELGINISKEFLVEGENIISLQSELWSPSDYGSEDSRNLGFSIKSITFEPIF